MRAQAASGAFAGAAADAISLVAAAVVATHGQTLRQAGADAILEEVAAAHKRRVSGVARAIFATERQHCLGARPRALLREVAAASLAFTFAFAFPFAFAFALAAVARVNEARISKACVGEACVWRVWVHAGAEAATAGTDTVEAGFAEHADVIAGSAGGLDADGTARASDAVPVCLRSSRGSTSAWCSLLLLCAAWARRAGLSSVRMPSP